MLKGGILNPQMAKVFAETGHKDTIVSAINQANSAVVPVYAFDRLPAGGKLLTFVVFDAITAGKAAADALAKGINDTGKE